MLTFFDAGGNVFLANLARIQDANDLTQKQISSGMKVSAPEDAPDQVSLLLQLEASLSRNTQIQTNLTNVQTSATAADQAISSVLKLTDQAGSLAAQGASSTTSAQTRQELAQQVQGIFDQVLSLSQTAVGERYVFGGDADRSPSYVANPANANGVTRLSTAGSTSQVEDASGNLISVGLTAGQIFDHRNPDDSLASDNLFAALTSLYQALNNNDTDGINTALRSVQTSAIYVNQQQGFYGALQNRLTANLSTTSDLTVSLNAQISSIRSTDLGAASVQLTQGSTEYQAALQARSKVPHTTLFDYLG